MNMNDAKVNLHVKPINVNVSFHYTVIT